MKIPLTKPLLLTSALLITVWLTVYANHAFANPINSNKLTQASPPLRIAVAANFAPVLTQLLKDLPNSHHIKYQIISAATGTLYQQIKHGAPFDLFLAADTLRPKMLEQEQLIVTNSRHTYALGQLALWSASQHVGSLNILHTFSGYLAIANPNIAPYGKAAQQVLQGLSLWSTLKNRLVTGININQTFQQVRSQSVPLGIVALSQLKLNKLQGIAIPTSYYQPIAQQLVILKTSKQIHLAKKISDYLLSTNAQATLHTLGYLTINNKKESLPTRINNRALN